MSDAGASQSQGKYQASSLVVSPRPNEFAFPLREDELHVLCEGAVGDARASRDLSIGILVGTAVGLAGVFATTDWGTIWQPGKRGMFIFWVAALFFGVVASGTAALIYHQRVKKTRADSAYSRLTKKISDWFEAQQQGAISQPSKSGLTILSARYGAGATWIDVADRLGAKIQSGQLRITICNQELGGDPVPNTPKSIEVEYTQGGMPHSKKVPEGQVLSIPDP